MTVASPAVNSLLVVMALILYGRIFQYIMFPGKVLGTKKLIFFDFSEMMMIYNNKNVFNFEKHCDFMGEFWIRLCSKGLPI